MQTLFFCDFFRLGLQLRTLVINLVIFNQVLIFGLSVKARMFYLHLIKYENGMWM